MQLHRPKTCLAVNKQKFFESYDISFITNSRICKRSTNELLLIYFVTKFILSQFLAVILNFRMSYNVFFL